MTTQKAFASYDEVIDLHTESDTVSVIGIHTPTGNTPHRMFKGFFEQFKKYKYYGCSIKLVPAARLPADPLQVSYEAGEPTIDPRDLMNPLLFHGCHGNDLGQILNRLYTLGSDSDSINRMIAQFTVNSDPDLEQPLDGLELEQLYYKALTDKTWRKAHPQRGFYKAGLRPMIYSLATTHQILPDAPYGIGGFVPSKPEFDNVVGSITSDDFSADGMVDFVTRGQFITPRLTGLGWLDTKQVLLHAREDATAHFEGSDVVSDITEWLHGVEQASEEYMTLPSIFMGVILLPPAYKTEQYYRMIITHHFGFKGFRGISFSNDIVETPSYFNMNVDDYEYEPSPDPEPGPGPSPEPEPSVPNYVLSEFDRSVGTSTQPALWGVFDQLEVGGEVFPTTARVSVGLTFTLDGVDYQSSANTESGFQWVAVPYASGEGLNGIAIGLLFSTTDRTLLVVDDSIYRLVDGSFIPYTHVSGNAYTVNSIYLGSMNVQFGKSRFNGVNVVIE